MSEVAAAKAWVAAKLAASTALAAVVSTRIYEGHPPAKVRTMPRVIYTLQGDGEDIVTGSGYIAATTVSIEVVAEATSGSDTATAKDAIDTALHRTSGTQDSHQIIGCLRVMARSDEPDSFAGVGYYTAGGVYSLTVGQA